jgi:hypothetical protein
MTFGILFFNNVQCCTGKIGHYSVRSTCLASVLFGLFQSQGQSALGLGFSGKLWKSETCLFPDMTHDMQNKKIITYCGRANKVRATRMQA